MRIEQGQGRAAVHAWWLAVKLVAVPAIAWGLIRAFGITGVEAKVLLLFVALPIASNAHAVPDIA